MLTRNLRRAFAEVEKLSSYLEKNEWEAKHLSYNLEWANEEIKEIIKSSIDDTIRRLKMFEEEAILWASNRMIGSDGKPINISKAEQNKAKTQLKRIRRTIAVLEEMLNG